MASGFDELSAHEVLHVASVMQAMFEEHIVNHRFVEATPELRAAADALNERLADFYQLAGRVRFRSDTTTPS